MLLESFDVTHNLRMFARSLCVLLAVLPPGLHAGTEPEEAPAAAGNGYYRVPRATSAIRVDGILDEEAWRHALKIELPYEIYPGDNAPAPVRTVCYITYDERQLSVAFRAYDPDPSAIRAHLADRDTVERDDSVGFILDPFNDERRGFQFYVNPLGVQMDGNKNDVGEIGEWKDDWSWDAIWESAARVTAEGYEVEMVVPFTSLRFPRTEGEQTWGFMPFRSYPRKLDYYLSLLPMDRNRNCDLCQAAKLVGFSDIRPGRNLELAPTLTTSRTDDREPQLDAPIDHGGLSVSPGLSARWGITPNLSLNAALNPDFSQVEADVAQLDINTRFALFFPEKRPFYLEGADFFTTPLNVVYTRTVADPDWGIKLTGKEGRNALGFSVGRDTQTNLIFPSNQGSDDTSLDLEHTVSFLRYRRDVGAASTVGVMVNGRQGDGYHNRLYGADAHLRLGAVDTLRLQYVRSDTRYPDEVATEFDQPDGAFSDSALYFQYTHRSRDWSWSAAYQDLGRDFRSDTGFIPRVDTRRAGGSFERIWWGGPEDWHTRMTLGVSGFRTEDHDGMLTDQEVGLHGLLFARHQSFLMARVAARKEFFEGVTYEQNVGSLFFNIRPTGDLSLELWSRFGDGIDYENSRAGKLYRISPEMSCYFGRRLRLSLDHVLERLSVSGERLYSANLTQMRLVYQFSLRTFARAIVQYNRTSRDPSLYLEPVEPLERNLLTQLLFSYKVNPQTMIFLGYSENRTTEDFDDVTLNNRTVFLKIGYAWLM